MKEQQGSPVAGSMKERTLSAKAAAMTRNRCFGRERVARNKRHRAQNETEMPKAGRWPVRKQREI